MLSSESGWRIEKTSCRCNRENDGHGWAVLYEGSMVGCLGCLTEGAAKQVHLGNELTKAREMVKRFIVAQGHHLSDSWRDALIEDCGLVVDSIGFVRVPSAG